MGVMQGRVRMLALSTVAIVATAAACLRTESLGSEQSPVVTCDPGSCEGSPTPTVCADGGTVPSTGRCVRLESGKCGWEPGECIAPDARPSKYADAVGDTALMCGDALLPLTAQGPWDEEDACWPKVSHTFECVDKYGGAGMTCFFQISTSSYFLAPSTRIPIGSDYRSCTDEEHAKRAGEGLSFCP